MDALPSHTIFVGVALAGSALLVPWALRPRSRLPYPPGPKGLPIIGNLLDMPKEKVAETNERRYREYGKR